MLVDRYPVEDVFARVPELADQTDPVLVQLDRLLDDDQLDALVRADWAHRYGLTLVHGRHSTPAEVVLCVLVVRHRYAWSYQETVERVADSLVLRWFCRGYFQRVPDKTTRLRWAATIRPATVQTLLDRSAVLAKQAKVTRARKLRSESTCVQTPIHHPTASGRLGDGVRVLSRRIQRAKPLVQESLAGGTPCAAGCAPLGVCSNRSIACAQAANAVKETMPPRRNTGSTPDCSRSPARRCARRCARRSGSARRWTGCRHPRLAA
jgi:IS5 family transposase